MWSVILLDEVEQWFLLLVESDEESAALVAAAIDQLAEIGPALGRPLVDRIKGSSVKNLKELRPASAGSSEIRILFAFDPERQAVLLVAGNKRGKWKRWYAEAILVAERRWYRWLRDKEGDGNG